LPFFTSGQKTAKNFCHFSHVGKKLQKSKAIALTLRPFLATFAIFYKWAKNSKKSKAIALTFRPF
jgi:hypothetical protein